MPAITNSIDIAAQTRLNEDLANDGARTRVVMTS
jgi:hypothetical protein